MTPWPLLVAALVAFAGGWAANGWRLGQTHAAEQRDAARQAALDLGRAEDARDQLQARLDAADQRYTTETRQHAEALDALRRDVERERVRLRVRAVCPPAVGMPAADSGGVDTGTGAELATAARPDYFALRAGIEQQQTQLAACQSVVRSLITREPKP